MTQNDITIGTSHVILVSDEAEKLKPCCRILSGHGYPLSVCAAHNGDLLESLQRQTPSVILIDDRLWLPQIEQMLALIREGLNDQHVPVVILSQSLENPHIGDYLSAGADDFFVSSMPDVLLLARFRTLLDAARMKTMVQQQRKAIAHEMARRIREVQNSQHLTIRALAKLAEIRDPETGYHILRAQAYVRLLALDLRRQAHFHDVMSDQYVRELEQSALLHDIGKVGIPDRILQKPGTLTAEEQEIMKTHAMIGALAIEQAEKDAGSEDGFLKVAKEMAYWHHECWDGSGYPDGLSGELIPLSARLMAVADVFDALISRRIYKSRRRCEEAREIIMEGRGTKFDPDIVDAFERQYPAFCEAAGRYADLGMFPEEPEDDVTPVSLSTRD